ncbi:MAG: Rne/Rng family ribonuclease [Thermoguttaceae bacterium]|nr:Rne/Rng family ribonuclease [Thermoguttaceae bacterium]
MAKQEMLINASQTEECRIALVEDGVLEELYVERVGQTSCVGNIYKGVVTNVEQSIQAAFVDFGIGRNGFLHVSDLEPQYFRQGGFDPSRSIDSQGGRNGSLSHDEDFDEDDGYQSRSPHQERIGSRPRVKPPIQDILKRGDELLVQVIKEGIGTKGPTLSTYISIPGRYVVLMPALGRIGISRKIEDEDVRKRLRQIMIELDPPKGLGFIVRTAGADRTKKDFSRDIAYLLRLWKVIVKRIRKVPGPCAIYEESDMMIRTIRDVFSTDIDSIWIDEPDAYQRAKEFLEQVMPRCVDTLHYYEGKDPLFHKYHLDEEIAKIHQRKVPLKTGGSIVIDPTEALVAIDVNSGNFRSEDNAEDTAYQMNLHAAKEIARQLRLRDLGGVIVNDFIDMRLEKHRRGVERALRDYMRRDRARTKILRTSPFGLIEMTRQRIRPALKKSIFQDCPCCKGTGLVKTAESMSIEVMRMILQAVQNTNIAEIHVSVASEVADDLNNRKRREIAKIEDDNDIDILIDGVEDATPELCEFECHDVDGREIKFLGK